MWDGECPDTISGFEALFCYLRQIQKLFHPDILFPNLPEQQPDFLTPLPYNSKKAMAQFAQHLYSLMDMSLTTLSGHIAATENRATAKKLVRDKKSRDLLRLYFKDHGRCNDDIEVGINALKDLNEWRVQSAHKLVPTDGDQDYLLIASDLVGRLQYGLRAMLLAFMQAEDKAPDRMCNRVLSYKVG